MLAKEYLKQGYETIKYSSELRQTEDGANEYVFSDGSFIVFDWLHGNHGAFNPEGNELK